MLREKSCSISPFFRGWSRNGPWRRRYKHIPTDSARAQAYPQDPRGYERSPSAHFSKIFRPERAFFKNLSARARIFQKSLGPSAHFSKIFRPERAFFKNLSARACIFQKSLGPSAHFSKIFRPERAFFKNLSARACIFQKSLGPSAHFSKISRLERVFQKSLGSSARGAKTPRNRSGNVQNFP
jgi:hypothetical protein